MTLRAEVFRNAAARYAGYLVSGVVSFLLFPYVIRHLGNDAYGVWVLVGSLTGYLGLMDLGVNITVVKYVAEYRARGDEAGLRRVVSDTFFLYGIIGVVSFLVATVLSFVAPRIFHIGTVSSADVRTVLLVLGFSMSAGFPMSVFRGVVKGCNRYDIEAGINTSVVCVRALFTVVCLSRGYGIVALSLVSAGSSILGGLLGLLSTLSLLKDPLVRWESWQGKWPGFRTLLTYALPVFIVVLSDRLIFYTDSLVIGAFLPAAAITFYSLGSRFVEYMREPLSLIVGLAIPLASGFSGARKMEGNRLLLIEGTRYCLMATLLLGGLLLAFGRQLIGIWVGTQYLSSYIILVILTLPEFVALSQGVSSAILYGMARHRLLAILTFAQAAAKLVLSIVLVQFCGIVGVALGTAVPRLLTSFVIPLKVCRLVGVSPGAYVKNAVLAPVACAIPFAAYCVVVQAVEIGSMARLLGLMSGGCLVFGAGAIPAVLPALKRRDSKPGL